MPIPATSLEASSFLRMLVMGPAKRGKTQHVVSTSPGPVRVLLCEDDTALRGAKRETTNFDFERVRGWNDMMKFLVEAKKDAKEGKIKTLVVDPLNFWADRLMAEVVESTKSKDGNEDGRRAHPEFTKRIKHAIDLMMTVPAHLIVITHFMEVGGGDDPDKPKFGPGIVPLMPNTASRSAVHAMFYDVVWFDMALKGKESYKDRIFIMGAAASGPGCRNMLADTMPAHVGQFIEAMKSQAKKEGVRLTNTTEAVGAPASRSHASANGAPRTVARPAVRPAQPARR